MGKVPKRDSISDFNKTGNAALFEEGERIRRERLDRAEALLRRLEEKNRAYQENLEENRRYTADRVRRHEEWRARNQERDQREAEEEQQEGYIQSVLGRGEALIERLRAEREARQK